LKISPTVQPTLAQFNEVLKILLLLLQASSRAFKELLTFSLSLFNLRLASFVFCLSSTPFGYLKTSMDSALDSDL